MLCSLKVPASYEFKILNAIGVKPLNLRRQSVLCQEQLTELDLDLVGRKVSSDPSELCTGACRSALISLSVPVVQTCRSHAPDTLETRSKVTMVVSVKAELVVSCGSVST